MTHFELSTHFVGLTWEKFHELIKIFLKQLVIEEIWSLAHRIRLSSTQEIFRQKESEIKVSIFIGRDNIVIPLRNASPDLNQWGFVACSEL